MGAFAQLWLPKLRGVKRVRQKGRPPQPRVDEFRAIKQYEIFHRPFDLKFRGRINEWLNAIENEGRGRINDTLEANQLRLVRLYFFPRESDSKWLNQDEVLEKIKLGSKKKLKLALISALIRIWKKDRM